MDITTKSTSQNHYKRRKIKRNNNSGTTVTSNSSGTLFPTKVCASCIQPLGLILSRGSNCPKCGLKVCKRCKMYNSDFSSWNCLVCSKSMPNYTNTKCTSLQKPAVGNSIKRSWSISGNIFTFTTGNNRGSPILKSYTKLCTADDNSNRQFHSLPRMPSTKLSSNNKNNHHHHSNGGYNQHRHSVEFYTYPKELQLLQSTLQPYTKTSVRKSPSSSINFIEDEYWDYYDYELNDSSRSSCERSLGETVVEYTNSKSLLSLSKPPSERDNPMQMQSTMTALTSTLPLPPKKPERGHHHHGGNVGTKLNKSHSLGAYDIKYSKLKTYCVINNNNNLRNEPVVVKNLDSNKITQDQQLSNFYPKSNNHLYHSLPIRSKNRQKQMTMEKENIQSKSPIYSTKTNCNTLPREFKQNIRITTATAPTSTRKVNHHEYPMMEANFNHNQSSPSYNSNTLPKTWKPRQYHTSSILLNSDPMENYKIRSLSLPRKSYRKLQGNKKNVNSYYIKTCSENEAYYHPTTNEPENININNGCKMSTTTTSVISPSTNNNLRNNSSSTSTTTCYINNHNNNHATTMDLVDNQNDVEKSLNSSPIEKIWFPSTTTTVSPHQINNNSSNLLNRTRDKPPPREVIIAIKREFDEKQNEHEPSMIYAKLNTNIVVSSSSSEFYDTSMNKQHKQSETPNNTMEKISSSSATSSDQFYYYSEFLPKDEEEEEIETELQFQDCINSDQDFKSCDEEDSISIINNSSSMHEVLTTNDENSKVFSDEIQYANHNGTTAPMNMDVNVEEKNNSLTPASFLPEGLIDHQNLKNKNKKVKSTTQGNLMAVTSVSVSSSKVVKNEKNDSSGILSKSSIPPPFIVDESNIEPKSNTTTLKTTVNNNLTNSKLGMTTTTPSATPLKYKSRVLINVDNEVEISNRGSEIDNTKSFVTVESKSGYLSPSSFHVQTEEDIVNGNAQSAISNHTITNDDDLQNETDETNTMAIKENDKLCDTETLTTKNPSRTAGPDLYREIRNTVEKMPIISYRRESPDGEESDTVDKSLSPSNIQEPGQDSVKIIGPPPRSSPDGADKSDEDTLSKTPVLELNSGDDESNDAMDMNDDNADVAEDESTDSWTEEISFEEEEKPPPLDLTLHTIVEESCEDSEPESLNPNSSKPSTTTNELEKYFTFIPDESLVNNLNNSYEESEFSDTFSESSYSSGFRNSIDMVEDEEGDPVELASGRLEKYFLGLGQLSNDSDSVGSESESGSCILNNKKKVLKHHHRRSSDFEDDDDFGFEQDGFDTIKKQRKAKKVNDEAQLQETNENNATIPSTTLSPGEIEQNDYPTKSSSPSSTTVTGPTVISVSRSNSFTWSSDEEVNLMMSKLRQLIKNLAQNKQTKEGVGSEAFQRDEKYKEYLESELIRLMKSEQGCFGNQTGDESEEDVYKFFEKVENDNQPELLSKVMTHIGERLSTWMRDEEEESLPEENCTIKCAPSISSDLNEDRFSWKGSFESTLAKRQSVGSTDSLDAGPENAPELFPDRSILRSSSLHHLANSQPILEESESSLTGSLSKLNQSVPSSSTNNSSSPQQLATVPKNINRAKSLFLNSQNEEPISSKEIKSARYRPPGYFESSHDTHSSTPTLPTLHNQAMEKESGNVLSPKKNVKIRGQIEFLMQYNYKCSNFEVSIKQCRDLAAADSKRGRSDPYVKAYLLPDRSKSSKRKTKTKKNTLNPVFGEVLKFPIALEELESRSLWLTVWHSDIFGKNEFLGQVSIPLEGVTYENTSYSWYSLSEPEETSSSHYNTLTESQVNEIDLIIALKWNSNGFKSIRGNLMVLVKEAKGLKPLKNSTPSTYVKCTPLSDKSKRHKTPNSRKSLNPAWNMTMTFENVTNEGVELCLCYIELLSHETLGTVKLDFESDLWRNMIKREGFWVEGIVHLIPNT